MVIKCANTSNHLHTILHQPYLRLLMLFIALSCWLVVLFIAIVRNPHHLKCAGCPFSSPFPPPVHCTSQVRQCLIWVALLRMHSSHLFSSESPSCSPLPASGVPLVGYPIPGPEQLLFLAPCRVALLELTWLP